MHEPTYQHALSRAWALVRHHPITWILGLLSVVLGQLGLGNFIGFLAERAVSTESWWPASWRVVQIATLNDAVWFGWLAILLIALAGLIAAVAICAQGALITAALHWFRFHTTLSFKAAWRRGVGRFWSLLGINLLEKTALSALVLITLLIVRQLSLESWGGFVGAIAAVAISSLLALTITAIAIYSLGYSVASKDSALVVAVARGAKLFFEHLLVSLELALVLVACNFVIVAVLSASSVLALVPSIILSLTAGLTGYAGFLTISVVLYFFLLIAAAAYIGAVFNAFTTSAWMYLFMKMHHEGMASRILHYARRLAGKK